eukprot:Blabericola_migrator_1__3391@NODE_1_length_33786_cov_123_788665_g0_i0_p12_GENE_NODE_1_length_33786_cov_123_788665_g0_i0NODE_1_length_33786_cov_123_788665_g0_i0_p12_ORF_typecomplete_len332_score35_38_NODE_1_length_33786_cov_123_788665_g0_i063727367
MEARMKIGGVHRKTNDSPEDRCDLVAIRLQPGAATRALYRRRLKVTKQGSRDEWKIQLAPELPPMAVVDVKYKGDDLFMICRVPDQVLTRTIAWGHTQWSSTLARMDMKISSFCGIRYVNSKVRHNIGAFVSLGATAPIFSVGQVALVCLAKELHGIVMAIWIVYVVFAELMVVVLAESRRFGFAFSMWQFLIAVDLLLKFIGAAYEFAAVVKVSSVTCSEQESISEETTATGSEVDEECLIRMSRKAWLNVGSLFAGTLSFFVAACLWWVARRLRHMVKEEDKWSRILTSDEMPIKVHSPKPVALWLMGAAPFRHYELQNNLRPESPPER